VSNNAGFFYQSPAGPVLRNRLYLDAHGTEKIAWRKYCSERPADVSSRFMKNERAPMSKKLRSLPRNGHRELIDLISVGPATVRALHSLGVRSVAQLARAKPESLYSKLCRLRGRREDPCCLDVFSAAVAQARNSNLPAEKCAWWYWSQQRKAKTPARRGAHG
jgi:hypothetical protein